MVRSVHKVARCTKTSIWDEIHIPRKLHIQQPFHPKHCGYHDFYCVCVFISLWIYVCIIHSKHITKICNNFTKIGTMDTGGLWNFFFFIQSRVISAKWPQITTVQYMKAEIMTGTCAFRLYGMWHPVVYYICTLKIEADGYSWYLSMKQSQYHSPVAFSFESLGCICPSTV
jgi:hypothetical protein